MAVDRWSEVLALFACVLGLVVVVVAWPRRSGPRPPSGGRPPESPAAVAVKLDTIGAEPRWRVANRHAILDVSIDIVAYRAAADADGAWVSEPIDEPVTLSPGRSATLPSVVEDPGVAHDVVVAWTVHHLDGGASHRRTFRSRPDAEPPVVPAAVVAASGSTRGLATVYGVIAALLLVVGAAAAWRLFDAPASSPGVVALPTARSVVPAPAPATPSPGEQAPPTTRAAPANAEPAPATTSAPTTALRSPTSTTPAPSTAESPTTSATTTAPSTTTSPPGRRITIDGRIDACQFGPGCLIASFRLDGLPREGDYVCEFADGSRYTFRYERRGAADACAASGRNPSITIEVDGVRSATITRDSLTGD